ncbi:hypothetical protein RB195_007828 [Necator americanus]|uniref:SCP domain-containing protein n=1 Tax=Necator americanus TaxID=51031 RepID=A0ABR1BZ51_NECAM
MFTFLVVLLSVYGATAQQKAVCSSKPTDANDPVRYAFLNEQNTLRKTLAAGNTDDGGADNLYGSKSLFQFTYNCDLEISAMTAAKGCPTTSSVPNEVSGNSINYKIIRTHQDPPIDNEAKADITTVVTGWAETRYEAEFERKTAIYDVEDTAPFVRIVYNKSISVGCVVTHCGAKKTAYTCAYSSSPVKGEPFYWPVKGSTGCTSDSQCKKAISGSKCNVAPNEPVGLCATDLTELTTAGPTDTTAAESTTSETTVMPTTTSTAAAAETTTATSSSTLMTDEIRDKIVTMHNYRRSLLAQGTVRNGKEGKPNCGTAKNMYRMKYDKSLETEAQKYADTCALVSSGEATRPQSGENTYVVQSDTVSPLSAVEESIKSWWKQILSNGINAKMQYTEFLSTKRNAPLNFIQMAWANSYKIGCGVSRCTGKTFVVCRYNPRGNVLNEYIYNVGSICASCPNSCTDSLCDSPAN